MKITLVRSPRLRDGTVALPAPWAGGKVNRLRLGCAAADVREVRPAWRDEVELAADLWDALSLPYNRIRMRLRRTSPGELELGPAIAILYAGRESDLSRRTARDRAAFYYGHLGSVPGLLALAFDEDVDLARGVMTGYVADNRPGREGEAVPARFPIPAAVRMAWSIRRDLIGPLREITGDRTFNWVRNMSKWDFHTLLSTVPDLAGHLPDTRRMRSVVDLMAMLARHQSLFVKHAYGIQGRGAVRIQRDEEGFIALSMRDGAVSEARLEDVQALYQHVRSVVGSGVAVVQQGIPITGREGRALDFRVLLVRTPDGGWRCAAATANLAPDERVIFTNLANGATDEPMEESLQRHHGLAPEAARERAAQMVDLCMAAARALEQPFHPLGMLGFDVALEAGSDRIWLFEANTVPGWGYEGEVDLDLARSQAEYALALTGFR